MKSNHINIVEKICRNLQCGNTAEASTLAHSAWPFEPQAQIKRSMSPQRLMDLWLRDGFVDRYTGHRLIYPGALRLLSILMPAEFPYHQNWKLDQCHMIHWELYPSHDHVHPAALGGVDDMSNLVTCSMLVNAKKGHWTLDQLGWKLKPSGNVEDWDGQTAWFVRMIDKTPSLLKNHKPLKQWHRIARLKGF